jgi:hypothetical protein
MSIVVDCHDGEDSGCRQLLALHELWRDLERQAAADAAVQGSEMAVSRNTLVRELHELIAALERRVPRVERAGEAAIARDAAALKAKALQRIAELEAEDARRQSAPGARRRSEHRGTDGPQG